MEKIEDAEELSEVRRQARTVLLKAMISSLALSLLALALPSLG